MDLSNQWKVYWAWDWLADPTSSHAQFNTQTSFLHPKMPPLNFFYPSPSPTLYGWHLFTSICRKLAREDWCISLCWSSQPNRKYICDTLGPTLGSVLAKVLWIALSSKLMWNSLGGSNVHIHKAGTWHLNVMIRNHIKAYEGCQISDRKEACLLRKTRIPRWFPTCYAIDPAVEGSKSSPNLPAWEKAFRNVYVIMSVNQSWEILYSRGALHMSRCVFCYYPVTIIMGFQMLKHSLAAKLSKKLPLWQYLQPWSQLYSCLWLEPQAESGVEVVLTPKKSRLIAHPKSCVRHVATMVQGCPGAGWSVRNYQQSPLLYASSLGWYFFLRFWMYTGDRY